MSEMTCYLLSEMLHFAHYSFLMFNLLSIVTYQQLISEILG